MNSGILLTSYGLATKINTSGRRLDDRWVYTSTWSFAPLVGLLVMAADVLRYLHCYVECFVSNFACVDNKYAAFACPVNNNTVNECMNDPIYTLWGD